MKELETLRSIIDSKGGTADRRRKIALAAALKVYESLEKSAGNAKSIFFHAVLKPLKNVDLDNTGLDEVKAGLVEFEKRLPDSLKEYRLHLVKDPDSRWAKATQYSGIGKKSSKSKDTSRDKRGVKQRPFCDSCGAPLIRKGPARRFGWGLYKCDYCGAEYTVKE